MSDISSALRPVTVGANAFFVPRFSGGVSASSSAMLARNRIGRRIANWVAGVYAAVRAEVRTTGRRFEPDRRYYHHPHREAFLEDAAMARAMYRL
jgi:hypothetical protein